MNTFFIDTILRATDAEEIYEIEVIQSLWSGYGQIVRYGLKGSKLKTVVVKHVHLPKQESHPRGWNTNLSHERKVKSYQVETAWYQQWSKHATTACRMPQCFAIEKHKDEVLIVLEDLDSSGYPARRSSLTVQEMKMCLQWLAEFHATYMGKHPENLWEIGSYWHLDTRPDELEVLEDKELKKAAKQIDRILNESPYKTFVHGDAKLANFCFSEDGRDVSAVDFQYVGGGCGMKDVAYFIGSCLHEEDCELYEKELLNAYFEFLRSALTERQTQLDVSDLESNWRSMYALAWTDFHRFLKGWSPGHWKINSYSERLSQQVLKSLQS